VKSGVLVIDKPRGPTSHDLVSRVRRALRTRHVGHAGTLDPMATGVLVVAVGEATKLVPWLTADDKTYEATIRLGIETDTLDADGEVTRRAPVPANLDLDAALARERSRTEQIPPAYSAIRVEGRRSHELARAGQAVDLPPRPIEVRALEFVRRDEDAIVVRVHASKGYFVRSLGRDLADALGTVGHLTALRRIRSGAFGIEDARPIEDASLLSTDEAAKRALPVTILDEATTKDAGHGKAIAQERVSHPHERPSAWIDEDGRLVAVGVFRDGLGRVLRGFPKLG
jgi:tRNA pseudouridine55 synthase